LKLEALWILINTASSEEETVVEKMMNFDLI